MDTLSINDIPEVFEYVAAIFAEKKDELCEMDAAMGDGDLGLTMDKGFRALPDFLRETASEGEIGKQLVKAAMKMQNLVPSTMGTLMSSGIMAAGKALKGKEALTPPDLATFAAAFAEGVQKRGKCELGDRTLLDAADAGAQAAAACVASNPEAGFSDVAAAAAEGALAGCEATKDMLPKFGKAAVHAAKAKGVVDQGALAGAYLLIGIRDYFAEQR